MILDCLHYASLPGPAWHQPRHHSEQSHGKIPNSESLKSESIEGQQPSMIMNPAKVTGFGNYHDCRHSSTIALSMPFALR